MTMPAFYPNRRAPDAPAAGAKNPWGEGVPGILGLKASDSGAIGILPVPPLGRFGTGAAKLRARAPTGAAFALAEGDRPLDQLAEVCRGEPVEVRQDVGVAAIVVGDEESVGIGLQQVIAGGVADLE